MSKPDPSAVFSALGDPIRLELLARLSRAGGMALGELVADTGVSRQGATKHLRILEGAGLVESRMQGRERRVTLAPDGLFAAQDFLGRIAQGWEDTLGRLKLHAERMERD